MSLAKIIVSLNWLSENTAMTLYIHIKGITGHWTRTYHRTEFKVVSHQFNVKINVKKKRLTNSLEHNKELDRTYFSQHNIYSNNHNTVQNVLSIPVDYTFWKIKTVSHSSQPPQCLAECHHA